MSRCEEIRKRLEEIDRFLAMRLHLAELDDERLATAIYETLGAQDADKFNACIIKLGTACAVLEQERKELGREYVTIMRFFPEGRMVSVSGIAEPMCVKEAHLGTGAHGYDVEYTVTTIKHAKNRATITGVSQGKLKPYSGTPGWKITEAGRRQASFTSWRAR